MVRIPTGRARRVIASVLASALLVAACGGGDDADDSADAADAAPTPGDGGGEPAATGEWVVEAPEDHGLDPALLEEARAYAFADGRNTQGVVVVRDGVIVAEWYADGAGPDSWAASWSVAKSFTSALVGIAIDEGKIAGVDEPMTAWYPEFAGTEREAMTLGDVLQMQSGLDWVEDYDPGDAAQSDIIGLVVSERDHLAFAAAQPARVAPGTEWNYSSGDTMLLSGVLEQATGMPVGEYADEVLFEPVGMDQVDWWRDATGHTLTYCCLDTPSRDFARFGQLYLQDGRWGDEQVVPEDWVADSIVPSAATEGTENTYGYQWWIGAPEGVPESAGTEGAYAAVGHDGQWIFVLPALDMVVVRNGTYVKDPGPPVADPNLFARYPPDDLVPGRGTAPPDDWDHGEFLGPIVEAAG